MKTEFEILSQSIRQCSECQFRNSEIEPLAPAPVTIPVLIMFVGENPSWAEGQSIPFAASTPSGQALDKHYLQPLSLIREEVWITDLFKCRYPKGIYRAKLQHDKAIQKVAETCARLWLLREIMLVHPKVIVTLSDKQVYQRLRRAFDLHVPQDFSKAVGQPHAITLAETSTILFPMVHPDISRPLGDGDTRKSPARKKWALVHRQEHIPALKGLLKAI